MSKTIRLSEYMTTLTFPDPHGGPDYSMQANALHMSWSQRIDLVELADQTLNGTIHPTTMEALYQDAKAQEEAVRRREALREIKQTMSFQREVLSQIYDIHLGTAGGSLRRRQQPDQTAPRSGQSASGAQAVPAPSRSAWQAAYERWEPQRDRFVLAVGTTIWLGWWTILPGSYFILHQTSLHEQQATLNMVGTIIALFLFYQMEALWEYFRRRAGWAPYQAAYIRLWNAAVRQICLGIVRWERSQRNAELIRVLQDSATQRQFEIGARTLRLAYEDAAEADRLGIVFPTGEREPRFVGRMASMTVRDLEEDPNYTLIQDPDGTLYLGRLIRDEAGGQMRFPSERALAALQNVTREPQQDHDQAIGMLRNETIRSSLDANGAAQVRQNASGPT